MPDYRYAGMDLIRIRGRAKIHSNPDVRSSASEAFRPVIRDMFASTLRVGFRLC